MNPTAEASQLAPTAAGVDVGADMAGGEVRRPFSGYPGGKGGAGVAQQIVSLMPAHTTYVELFVGGGSVFLKKRPSTGAILVDADREVIQRWSTCRECGSVQCGPELWAQQRTCCPDCTHAAAVVLEADATRPETWPMSLRNATLQPTTLVYADPPYLRSTRTKRIYRHELLSPEDHTRLLEVLKSLPCMVMVSGYWSQLYADLLSDWRSPVAFPAGTRGGRRIEHVWCNFPDGLPLHDTRFLGRNRHDRERIRRKRASWARRFAAMHPHERQAVYEELVRCMA